MNSEFQFHLPIEWQELIKNRLKLDADDIEARRYMTPFEKYGWLTSEWGQENLGYTPQLICTKVISFKSLDDLILFKLSWNN